ncbi:hypothetical protein [Oceanibaculum nanhaiense]|uniref:hypothetical protein n=1 Tax=Oceanibaculum nanhaiense TaxID=1909734 RepID=UPI0032EC0952
MTLGERINRFFMNLEWRLSLIGVGVTAVSSFVLPAWAVRTANLFADYAPFSWVTAGFLGALTGAIIYAIVAWARSRWVRAGYDHNLYKRSGFVDPMAATYENKRIFLADFVLPSDPHISGKTFINCEIVGPANLFIRQGNQVNEQILPICDAVVLNGDRQFYNGITFDNCTFRKCSFKRITLMLLPYQYEQYKNLDWLNWISRPESSQMNIPGL